MTFALSFVGSLGLVVLSASTAMAQSASATQTTQGTGAVSIPIAGMLSEFAAVKGLPYSLLETKIIVRTSPDGATTKTRASRSMRDSDGRTRVEAGQMVDGVFEADHIMITDPGARFQANFDTNSQTGKVNYLPVPKIRTPEEEAARVEQKAEAREASKARDAASPDILHLGSRTIAGVNAEGTRRPSVITVMGAQGPSQVRLMTERWWSPELKIELAGTTDDPRGIKTTSVVTDLQRVEPDAALFKIPKGYTVTVYGKP